MSAKRKERSELEGAVLAKSTFQDHTLGMMAQCASEVARRGSKEQCEWLNRRPQALRWAMRYLAPAYSRGGWDALFRPLALNVHIVGEEVQKEAEPFPPALIEFMAPIHRAHLLEDYDRCYRILKPRSDKKDLNMCISNFQYVGNKSIFLADAFSIIYHGRPSKDVGFECRFPPATMHEVCDDGNRVKQWNAFEFNFVTQYALWRPGDPAADPYRLRLAGEEGNQLFLLEKDIGLRMQKIAYLHYGKSDFGISAGERPFTIVVDGDVVDTMKKEINPNDRIAVLA